MCKFTDEINSLCKNVDIMKGDPYDELEIIEINFDTTKKNLIEGIKETFCKELDKKIKDHQDEMLQIYKKMATALIDIKNNGNINKNIDDITREYLQKEEAESKLVAKKMAIHIIVEKIMDAYLDMLFVEKKMAIDKIKILDAQQKKQSIFKQILCTIKNNQSSKDIYNEIIYDKLVLAINNISLYKNNLKKLEDSFKKNELKFAFIREEIRIMVTIDDQLIDEKSMDDIIMELISE